MQDQSLSYGFIRNGRTIRHFETVVNEDCGFIYKVYEFEPGEEAEEIYVCGLQWYPTEEGAATAMRTKMEEYVSIGWQHA